MTKTFDRAAQAVGNIVALEHVNVKIPSQVTSTAFYVVAMGFTREHILHRYTLRLLSWRDDFGNESYWAAALGNRIAAGGAEELWPLLASR